MTTITAPTADILIHSVWGGTYTHTFKTSPEDSDAQPVCQTIALQQKNLSALVRSQPPQPLPHWQLSPQPTQRPANLSLNQQGPMSSCCSIHDSSRNYPEDTMWKTARLLPLSKFPRGGRSAPGRWSSAWDSWTAESCYISLWRVWWFMVMGFQLLLMNKIRSPSSG